MLLYTLKWCLETERCMSFSKVHQPETSPCTIMSVGRPFQVSEAVASCLLTYKVLVYVIRYITSLFESYLSNHFIRVVTPLESSDLYPVTAGVPQAVIWSPLLFNLYIRQLSTVVKHCLILGICRWPYFTKDYPR